ncbi:unnamed protein product [Linum trigynum]|uniref:Uncharacterized protein n=1 Tax=Linum trigynum TaxID=586398 RepID=A0AAV2CB95_9ROSI
MHLSLPGLHRYCLPAIKARRLRTARSPWTRCVRGAAAPRRLIPYRFRLLCSLRRERRVREVGGSRRSQFQIWRWKGDERSSERNFGRPERKLGEASDLSSRFGEEEKMNVRRWRKKRPWRN